MPGLIILAALVTASVATVVMALRWLFDRTDWLIAG